MRAHLDHSTKEKKGADQHHQSQQERIIVCIGGELPHIPENWQVYIATRVRDQPDENKNKGRPRHLEEACHYGDQYKEQPTLTLRAVDKPDRLTKCLYQVAQTVDAESVVSDNPAG